MDENPEEPQCVCANNYVEGKGTESVLFSVLFSPEDGRHKRNERKSSTTKEAVRRNVSVMRANYDQYSTLTSNPRLP